MTDLATHQCCGNCKFWLLDEDVDSKGRCRRHAPHVGDAQFDSFSREMNYTQWPLTVAGDWCGEWIER